MSWRSSQLGDVLELRYGKALPDRDRKFGDIPVYGSGGIGGWHDAALVSGPGVIVGRKGSVGSVFYEARNFFPIDTAYYVVPKVDQIDLRYSYFLLSSLQLASMNSDVAVPGLNRDRALGLEIRLPSMAVQKSIADLLSTYDDLIENNRRRMALLEESARLLYREWFVRLRFPGYEHTPIVDGVPQGWERKTLGEVTYINQRNLANTFDGEIEYIDIASVTRNSVNETTTYEFRDAPGRARRVVRHGDIIWSCVRPNRRSHAVIWQPAENLIASTGFVVMSPKSLPTSFLYQAVTTDLFVGYLENHAKGAAYPAVVSGDFERATILVPPSALLTSFDEVAAPLLDQGQNLAAQIQKLRTARNVLLPRLMSGELAV